MNSDLLQVGEAQAHWNVASTRILKYTVEISHNGLKEHKLISAPELDILQTKAELQATKWNEKWVALEAKRKIKEKKEANIEEAENRSKEAQEVLKQVETILLHTLSIDDTVDWESIKKKDHFKELTPPQPKKNKYYKVPAKPDKKSSQFVPTFTFIEKLLKSKKEKKIKEFDVKYENIVTKWESQKEILERNNSKIDQQHEVALDNWKKEVKKWEVRKEAFSRKQEVYNHKIDKLRNEYFTKEGDAVTEYCEMVLNNSTYPGTFPKSFEIEYNPENQILIIEYDLPPKENLPTINEVKYIASKKELKESYISESQLNKMYDSVMYQITLRTLHELYEADAADAIKAISFNGWVNSINKATGKSENKCILSIQANKEEFLEIQLSNVDPKMCFKTLKGVASSKLSTLTPIQPILQISRTDKRFIEGYDVAYTLDEATNIAAMDWGDFEHLIRELFEKEFSVNGGEVKVTQASRDGGVDAIAFDPDPIRGGKIVIQAKRYTNTVGVSAVRDLYGTVVNEGATKGILVTTADYGPDAYKFARGKPLTLLSGSNLLHLLEKHGHHAKIDLKEAKKILAEDQ
jgi:restriction system protein